MIELNNLVVEIEEIVNSHSTQSTQRYPLNGIEGYVHLIISVERVHQKLKCKSIVMF